MSTERWLPHEDGGLDPPDPRRAPSTVGPPSPRLASYEHDLTTDRLSLSATSAACLDLEAAAFDGRWGSFLARIHAEDRAAVTAALREAVATGLPYEIEFRLQGPDGALRRWNERGLVLGDDRGRPVRRVGIVRDVTTQHRAAEEAERALERARAVEAEALRLAEQLHVAQTSAGAGVWAFDIRRNQVYWSAEYYELYGLAPSTPPSYDNWIRSIHPADRERIAAAVSASLADRSSTDFEFRVLHPRLGERWLQSIGRVFVDAAGTPLHVSGITLDVTERKRAEEALRENEERLRLALEAGRMGTWEWDLATGEVRWDALEDVLGGAARTTRLSLEHFFSYVHPEDLPDLKARVQAATRSGGLQTEFRVRRPDGQLCWLASHGDVLRDAQGRASKLIGVNFDITQRKQEEVQSQRLNRELAARIHEFQTLLLVLPVGIAVASDVDCRAIQGNPAIGELLGIQTEGQPFTHEPAEAWPRFHREGQPVPLGELPLQRAAREGVVVAGLELGVVRANGAEVSVLAYAAPLRDEHGQVRGAIAAFLDITERRRAEQALRKSEAQYRGLIENIPAITYIAHPEDPINTTLYFSPQSQTILGIPPEDYMREPDLWVKHLHMEDRERVLTAVEHMMTTREPFLSEYRMTGRDGRVVWLRDHGRWIQDDEGRIICLQGVMLDITDRKRAEETLRESEARMRLVTEVIPQLVWTSLPDGSIDFCNERWLRYTGLTMEEVQGDGWAAALHPEDRARIQAAWQQAYRQGMPLEDEERLRRADGSYRWFLVRAMPLRDDSGRIVKWFGTCTDIQDRKEAEEALRRSEERWQTILRATQDGVWEWDCEAQRAYWSPRLKAMLGYEEHELVVSLAYVESLIHPEDLAEVRARVLWHQRGKTPFYVHEHRLRHRDGSYRWMLCRGLSLREAGGKPMRMLGTYTDITEHKRTEEVLKEADRRKDEFLAMLAHELRNPLAPIRNAVYVLRELAPAGEDLKKAEDMIERQVGHMTRLVDDLLDVSRITRGKILLRTERLDLTALVRAAAEDHRRLIEEAGLTLAIELPHAPLWVRGDPTRLTQVVGNLLHNASKFTDGGGRVTVRLGRDPDGGTARLAVSDSGIGMEAEILERLFEPFSQADRSLDRSRGGLGLGLALVKGLVELHGGRVQAASAGPGKGSEFTIVLPIAREAAAPERREAARPAAGRVLRVLVIEDNQDGAESLRMMLEIWGYPVALAYTGPAGVEAFDRFHPEVVLCDIGLPGGMDGYAVARALREAQGPRPVHLVAVSGYGQEEDQRRAREAGFDRHLTKPLDPMLLRRLLEDLSQAAS